MKPENLTPKGIFEDVISLTWTLNFYLDKGKDYEPLIKFLIEKRFDNIDELPSIKDLVWSKKQVYLTPFFQGT